MADNNPRPMNISDACTEIFRLEAVARELCTELEAYRLECERLSAQLSWVAKSFSPMGLSIDGNHSWVWRGSPARLTGETFEEAVKAAMKKGRT